MTVLEACGSKLMSPMSGRGAYWRAEEGTMGDRRSGRWNSRDKLKAQG